MRRVSTALPADLIHAKFRLRLGLFVAAVAAVFLGLVPTAMAAKETFATLGGAAGVGGGQFSAPRGIAVNQNGNGAPAGTFYVVDSGNNRIQQFGPEGSFVRTWGWGVRSGEPQFEVCAAADKCLKGTAGNNPGQLNQAQGITVDSATGNVFVSNNGSRRISVFSSTGSFMGSFGWGAIDGGNSLQFCTFVTGCGAPGEEPSSEGTVGGGQFGTLGGLATDAEGNLYAANRTSRRVDVFKPLLLGSQVTGIEFLRSFGWGAATGAEEFEVCTASPCSAPAGTGTAAGQFSSNSPGDVGVDDDGNIYALDNGSRRVQKFSPAPAPLDSALGAAVLTSAFANGQRIALAVEPETNHVLVLGNRQASSNRVAIVEMTSEGAAVDTHGTSFTGNSAVGLAVAQPSIGGTVYFSSSAESLQRVFALNDPALVPTIEPVTGISATEATFNGQVVSDEVESAYQFEYSTDGVEWTPAPSGAVSAQPGSAAVQETVGELVPNTKYGVRLTAMRPAGSWKKRSQTASFTTSAIAPTVTGGMATEVTNSSARLVTYLNPNNSATSYRFEYGTTEAYGSTTSTLSAGDGSEQVTVSQVVKGLAPNTTYHFRVVATNSAGEEVGSDLTFTTTGTAPSPPDGRAWELVSPADSNGQEVSQGENFEPTSASDGNGIAYLTLGPVPGAGGGGFVGNTVARRGPDGWTADPLNPVQDPNPIGGSVLKLVSDDLSRVGIMGPASPQPAPGGGEGTSNLFLLEPITDTFRAVSLNTPGNILSQAIEPVSGARDLGVVLFEFDGESLVGEGIGERQLYMWTEATETLDLVGRQPVTNEPVEWQTTIASRRDNDHPVSDDGSRIFFRTSEEADQIWVRINGTTTKHVSASHADPNEGSAVFRYAASDGSLAFFTSPVRLTEDATAANGGEDLYRYDVETEELTDITVAAGAENGAEVLGTLGGSDDGSSVYFAARGVLAPGAEAGAENLYLWKDDGSAKGSIEFVAPNVQERNYRPSSSLAVDDSPARVTPDGSKVLFTSTESLTDYPTNGYLQAYLYDAVADQLRCVSCNPLGGPIGADVVATGSGDLPRQGRSLSEDGRRVFFTSPEALAAEDHDSGLDVYEYDAHADQVNLVSAGNSNYSSLFQDAGDDGRDVFFTTRDALVGIDKNENVDLYDARIGGGFASQNPPPPPPPCGSGECQVPTGVAPPAAPGSATVQGPGNEAENGKRAKKNKKCKQGKKKRGKRCVGKAGKRHGKR